MAEILGLGVTHYPGLAAAPTQGMSFLIKRAFESPSLPEHLRTPEGWPELMRQEWDNDEGWSAQLRHRAALVREFRKVRRVLDEFAPDFMVVWGDDQYENFQEDLIPPFAILAYDTVEVRPWAHGRGPNAWGEPAETTFIVKGHRTGAKFLATGLLEAGFDVAYAYKPLHKDMAHAHMNTILYLDWDRRGFDHPIVPVAVNCYGRRVVSWRGLVGDTEAEEDPPAPSPARCFDLGAATARVLARSPWRVALIASSSWSHSFLASKNYYLYPDLDGDRELLAALREGDYYKWRERPLEAMEASGQHEMLNWQCLMGAMAELGRKPDYVEWIESCLNNSPKCFAYFRP